MGDYETKTVFSGYPTGKTVNGTKEYRDVRSLYHTDGSLTHYPTPKGGRKSRRSSHKHGRIHSKKQKCVHHTRRKRTRRHRHSRHRRR
jgi:hypothetical protein